MIGRQSRAKQIFALIAALNSLSALASHYMPETHVTEEDDGAMRRKT
jgi:hypothetical protein